MRTVEQLGAPQALGGRVADAMLRVPKVSGPDLTVTGARRLLRDDHVHAVLIVDDGRLVAVVVRPDLLGAPAGAPARAVGHLAGRVIGPDAELAAVHAAMLGRCRRLAVVDDAGRLLGLLCLKRSGTGFCSDADVASRAADVVASARPA